MSRFNIALAAVCAALSLSVALSSQAYADPSTAAANSAVPMADRVDADQLRHDLGPVAQAFGVKNPNADAASNSTDSTNAVAPTEHKTIGDVADRGLTMLQELTGKIADSLSKIAPQVWHIMLQQQIAKAIVKPLGSLAWMIGAFAFSRIGLSQIKKPAGEWFRDPDPTKRYEQGQQLTDAGGVALLRVIGFEVFPGVIGFFAFLVFVGDVQFSILHLMNPAFYAIQDLLSAIMTGQPPS